MRKCASRWLWLGLVAAGCSEPGSAPLPEPATEFPSFTRPETAPVPRSPTPSEAEPVVACSAAPEPVPILAGEAPPPYQVQRPLCGQALDPVEVEGFERTRLLDPLDVGLVGVPVGARAQFELGYTNDGDRAETFSAGWRGSAPFELDAPTVRVSPGETAKWSLAWRPENLGRFEAELEVRRGNAIETVLVDGSSIEGPELRCRVDLPDKISGEAAFYADVVCQNRSSVPVQAEGLTLTKLGQVENFDVRAQPLDAESIEIPALGVLRWPVEICPRARGVIGLEAQLGARTLLETLASEQAEAWSAIVGPQLQISGVPLLRPEPGATPLPVRFELRNSGLEPVDLLDANTPPDLRWTSSMARRIEPGDAQEALLEYVGTSSVPRTLEIGLQTSVGARTLAVRIEPKALEAGTDCIDDLAGFPETVNLGALRTWPSERFVRRVGSFTLQNLGVERCRFDLRGEGAIRIRRSLDLVPGERILIPIDVKSDPNDCDLTGSMALLDLDDWRTPRRFDVEARLVDDGPDFRLWQDVLSCRSPNSIPFFMELQIEDGGSLLEVDGLRADEAYQSLFESSDCERLNGHVKIRSESGRIAQLPIGLGPSDACGEKFEFEKEFQVDEFTMLSRPKVDVVWILDDSVSMRSLWPDQGENFDAFIQFVQAQGRSARLFARFLDAGWVHDEAGDPMAFDVEAGNQREPFLAALGGVEFRGGTERTLEVAVDAATSVELRPDAVLSVIAVTNEGDQSFVEVDDALNQLLGIKGFRNTHLFSFNAISGGELGCERDGLIARPAPRLVELANRSGGVEGSICTKDWSRTLEELSQVAFAFKSRFFLTNEPIIQSIEVWVDEVPLSATEPTGQVNWTYDFSTNSVNFLPLSVPGPGSNVRVRYELGCR